MQKTDQYSGAGTVAQRHYIELVSAMYAHPRWYGFQSEDEISEALTLYHQRIQKALERADAIGKNREAFLMASMRYIARNLQRVQYTEDLRSKAVLYAFPEEAVEWCWDESSSGYRIHCPDAAVQTKPNLFVGTMSGHHKQLLYLTLKCAWQLDDEMLAKCSRAIGMPPDCLFRLVEIVRRRTEHGMEALRKVEERLHAVWLRMRLAEIRLANACSSDEKARLLGILALYQRRYSRLLELRKQKQHVVPNEVIAALLGVPKGSVDSGLFYLRRKVGRNSSLAIYHDLL
ncbi:MAG: hypothetical protein WHT81_07410 [Rectinemataceae bacterium]|nr:hypothetical protein [Spirochaetaceae bacterium]